MHTPSPPPLRPRSWSRSSFFQAGDGTFGAVPADEIDGDEVVIVSEYDPFG